MLRKLFIILIILGVVILSAGCVQKNDVRNSKDNNQEYSSKVNLITYSTGENNEINQEEQFEVQLKEFYDFTQRFFPIWNNHIEDTAILLEKFNNKNTNLDDKIIYSEMLCEKYEKFNDNLRQIVPPPEASEAYQYILKAISKRILFFREFIKGTNMDMVIEIENEAYSYENLFWGEIDKIYDHYLGKIDKINNMSI